MYDNWTTRQKEICEGLTAIGGEAAGYFKSAMAHYYDESLSNRVSLLAHAAREIDGGLRDIFAPRSRKEQIQKDILTRGIEKVFGVEFKGHDGHIASILAALDVDERDQVAKEWITVATKFAKFAHRHGAWKEARSFDEFCSVWERYEEILHRLVGSFYSMATRIERLMTLEDISDASAGALANLLRKHAWYSVYFFKRLKNLRWFEPLKQHGFFSARDVPAEDFWVVLFYLEFVSEQVAKNPEQHVAYGNELLDIMGEVVRFSRDVQRVNNSHVWWYCVKIINDLPCSIIKANVPIEDQPAGPNIKYGFRTWLSAFTDPLLGGTLGIADVAEKLLGKFLRDDSTVEYAGVIVDAITRIKASGKPSALTGKDDIILVCDTYWVLDALRKHHEQIAAKCSTRVIYEIADRLSRALEYARQNYAVNMMIGDKVYEFGISRLSSDGLGPGEIGFKKNVYQCVLKQYAPEQVKGLDLSENFWALHKIEPEIERKSFHICATNREGFISLTKASLPTDIDWASTTELPERLRELFDGLYEDYSSVWCRSLQNGPEHEHDAESILTVILRDIVLSKCEADRVASRSILDAFLGERYRFPIFRKLVLLCTDQYWTNYSELFGRFLEITSAAFQDSDYEVELQDILRHHWQTLSPALIEKLKTIIDDVPNYYVKEGGEAVAHWKYRWLSPLMEHPSFQDAYEQTKQKVKPKGDKPYKPERSAFKGGVVGHKSPVSKEEILQKSNAELVKYLNEFQGADSWHGTFEGEPDKEGLLSELQAAVKAEPKRFIETLEVFHQVNYSYVGAILVGLKAAWNEGKALDSDDWERIFDFCLKYLSRDKEVFLREALQAQGEDSGDGKYLYVIENIVGLIAERGQKDDRVSDPKYVVKVGRLYDAILPLLKKESIVDTQRDAVTYAMNTTAGKVIESYILFSLRMAKATQKPGNWGAEHYERFFEIGIEASIWFGCYLPQMRYLDSGYVDNKIAAFASQPAEDIQWRVFMEGYLTGSQVYTDLYALMRPHYVKAVTNKVLEDQMDDRLIQHLCFGYLHFGELLQPTTIDHQPSLFWKMLDEANTPEKRKRWFKVAEFFWSFTRRTIRKEDQDQNEKTPEDVKKKIIEFWKWTHDQQGFVQSRLGDQYDTFLGRMALLTILLDKIDETTESWLLMCAPHIEREHNAAFFIEYLTKFEDEESIKRIGRIYRKVLESTTPTFKQEDIQLVVERLYMVGQHDPTVKGDADEISNMYGRHGFHFLKPIWDKHQQKIGSSPV